MARRVLSNYRNFKITELSDFSDITNFTLSSGDPGDGAAIAVDSTITHDGNSSLKITLDANSTTNVDFAIDIYPSDVKSGIGIRWYQPEGLVMTSFNLYIGTDAGFGAGTWTEAIGVAAQEGDFVAATSIGGWNYRVLNVNDFTAGTPSILANEANNLVICRISRASVGSSESFYLNRMVSGARVRKKGIISFDDGNETVYSMAYPYMAARGIVGTCYINGSLIGTAGYMTVANLTELQSAGWCIANHLWTHTDITTMTLNDFINEANKNASWLMGNGFVEGAYHFAYPNGAYTRGVHDELLKQYRYKTGRTIQATTINHHGIGPSQPFGLHAKGVNNTITAQNVIDKFNSALTFGGVSSISGDMAMTYIHGLTDGVDPVEGAYYWLESKFQTLINDCQTKQNQGMIDFVTIAEWYNGLSEERTSATRVAA